MQQMEHMQFTRMEKVIMVELSDSNLTPVAYISGKQPVVAKLSGESELIAENKTGVHVEWSRELVEDLGYPQGCVPMYVDSTCAMQMIKQGTGSFKRVKHIKVRYFWMKDMIEQGQIELIRTPTEQLVADILTKPM